VKIEALTTDVRCEKHKWIVQNGWMTLLNAHPDYLCFDRALERPREYPVSHYKSLLKHVIRQYYGVVWNATPRKVAPFYTRVMKATTARLDP
jgi:hypothetical protein